MLSINHNRLISKNIWF